MDEKQTDDFKKLDFDSDTWNKFSSSFSDAESAQMQNVAFSGGTILYKLISETTICVIVPQANGASTRLTKSLN